MAYIKHPLAALIEVDPKKAASQILDAYKKGKASQRDAAKILGVAESTIIRWVKLLDLATALARIKKQAVREGWHHEMNTHGGLPEGWGKKKRKSAA